MKNFSFNLLLAFAFLILFFSCKNSNQVKTSFRQKEFDQFFYQGQKDKAAGRNAEAILAFEKALNYKDEPTLHFEIAKLILESTGQDYSTTEKSLQDALEHIQKAVRTDQKNEWYNETLGQIYWAMGDEKDALQVFKTVVLNSQNIIRSGELHMDWFSSYPADGLSLLNEIESKTALSEELIRTKVGFLNFIENYKEAAQVLLNFEKLNKPSFEFYLNGVETIKNSNNDNDLNYWRQTMIQRFPDEAEVLIILSEKQNEEGNKSESYNLLKRAIATGKLSTSKIIDIHNSYSDLLINESNSRELFIEISKLIENTYSQNSEVLRSLAEGYDSAAMPKEKLRVLEAIYAIDKTDPEVILSILKIARSERNWSKCEQISDEALELYPLSPEMYYFNGVSKYKLGKLDSAEEILVTGRDIIIDDPKLLSDILSILGSVYYKKNEWSEAQLSFDAALIQNPENMSALNNYAYYMAKKNTNLNQALSYAQVANELSKNNGVYLDTYGFVLFRLKRYSDAEKAFKLAFDLLPDDAEVAEHYGDCLAVVNKIEEAMKYWQIALQLGSSSNNLKLKIESKKFIE